MQQNNLFWHCKNTANYRISSRSEQEDDGWKTFYISISVPNRDAMIEHEIWFPDDLSVYKKIPYAGTYKSILRTPDELCSMVLHTIAGTLAFPCLYSMGGEQYGETLDAEQRYNQYLNPALLILGNQEFLSDLLRECEKAIDFMKDSEPQ